MSTHPAHVYHPEFCPCPAHRISAEESTRPNPWWSPKAEEIAAHVGWHPRHVQVVIDAAIEAHHRRGRSLEVVDTSATFFGHPVVEVEPGAEVLEPFEIDTSAFSNTLLAEVAMLSRSSDDLPALDKRRRCVCPVSGLPAFEVRCHRCGGRRRKAR